MWILGGVLINAVGRVWKLGVESLREGHSCSMAPPGLPAHPPTEPLTGAGRQGPRGTVAFVRLGLPVCSEKQAQFVHVQITCGVNPSMCSFWVCFSIFAFFFSFSSSFRAAAAAAAAVAAVVVAAVFCCCRVSICFPFVHCGLLL